MSLVIDGTANMAGPFPKGFVPSKNNHPPKTTPGKYQSLFDIVERLCEKQSVYLYPDNLIAASDLLSEREINEFLQSSNAFEHYPTYATVMGVVTTNLIQNAHDNGLSHIMLDVNGLKPLQRFGFRLRENPTKKLEVVVHGELGSEAFYGACCTAYVEKTNIAYHREANGEASIGFWRAEKFTVFKWDVKKQLNIDPNILSYASFVQKHPLRDSYERYRNAFKNARYWRIRHNTIIMSVYDPYHEAAKYYTFDEHCYKVFRDNRLDIFYPDVPPYNEMRLWQKGVELFAKMDNLYGGKP